MPIPVSAPRVSTRPASTRQICHRRGPKARRLAAESAEMGVVSLEHVGKQYDAGAPILSDLSLDLERGGFYFLTGASGAGKTTLLRIIHLAEQPSRGRVRLFSADAAALDPSARAALRRRIGLVFQDLLLLDELSAGDNFAPPLRI